VFALLNSISVSAV